MWTSYYVYYVTLPRPLSFWFPKFKTSTWIIQVEFNSFILSDIMISESQDSMNFPHLFFLTLLKSFVVLFWIVFVIGNQIKCFPLKNLSCNEKEFITTELKLMAYSTKLWPNFLRDNSTKVFPNNINNSIKSKPKFWLIIKYYKVYREERAKISYENNRIVWAPKYYERNQSINLKQIRTPYYVNSKQCRIWNEKQFSLTVSSLLKLFPYFLRICKYVKSVC